MTDYVLGHSSGELRRLSTQARLIDPITRRFLSEAGIAPGMRVLDVGCGAGDTSFLAAALVGDSGEVVGVDRSEAAVETARERAAALSLRHVSFVQGDPAVLATERPFDAAMGRFVLQFQAEPSELLRQVASLVVPGGLVVFHELDWSGIRSIPPAPIHDQCRAWLQETMRRSGAEVHMGSKLPAAFRTAGLPVPEMRLESLVVAGPLSGDLVNITADLAATLAPSVESLGVATAAELDIPTLAERMSAEIMENNSVLFGHWQTAAWCRLPG